MQFEIACVTTPAFVATILTDWIDDEAAVRTDEPDVVDPMTAVTLTIMEPPVCGRAAMPAPLPPPPPHAASDIAASVIASDITALFDFCLVENTYPPSTDLAIVNKCIGTIFTRTNWSLPIGEQSYNTFGSVSKRNNEGSAEKV